MPLLIFRFTGGCGFFIGWETTSALRPSDWLKHGRPRCLSERTCTSDCILPPVQGDDACHDDSADDGVNTDDENQILVPIAPSKGPGGESFACVIALLGSCWTIYGCL